MDNTNIFIQKCDTLITSIMMENREQVPKIRQPVDNRSFIDKIFGKKVPEDEYTEYEDKFIYHFDVLKSAKRMCDDPQCLYNTDHNLPFHILWEYCEFIRWCEKMFIYTNNPTDNLVSDMQIDALDTRSLIINKQGFFIQIIFKMSQKADFDNVSDKLIFHEIKETNVKRSYGKEMGNRFKAVDGVVKFNDDSDKLLYELVNELVYDTVRNHFLKTIRDIENGNFINNMMFNDRFITP